MPVFWQNQFITMKKAAISTWVVLAVVLTVSPKAWTQESSVPAATTAELEAMYTASIENRVSDILALLNLTNRSN